jgi:RNA-binding motif X-linked protein 2
MMNRTKLTFNPIVQLTEGDVITIFSQFGEIVDVNLVRDKGTGKSKGFAFLAYEDQRSTVLAVDNFNGTTVCLLLVICRRC